MSDNQHSIGREFTAMDHKERCIVFDIGGTSTRIGLYNSTDRCLERFHKVQTPNFIKTGQRDGHEIVNDLMKTLKREAHALAGNAKISGICAAMPAPLSPDGNAWHMPTVLGPYSGGGLNLLQPLRALWPAVPVRLINDVTAAGYLQVAKGSRDFAIVTVGSGIGAKVFLDGVPRVGPNSRGGEIGHLRMMDSFSESFVCDCEGFGHLGSIASGRGSLAVARHMAAENAGVFAASLTGRLSGHQVENLNNEILVHAFLQGDSWAEHAVAASAKYLAQVLAFLHVCLGLEEIVIVGGFAIACGEKYRGLLATLADQYCWNLGQNWHSIVRIEKQPDTVALEGAGYFMTTLDIGKSSTDRIFTFEDAQFHWSRAHNGAADIASARVMRSGAISWIDLVRLPTGSDIGPHTHSIDEEEVYIVIEGRGTMMVEDSHYPVAAGDVIHNPPGATHGLVNDGLNEMRLAVVSLPASHRGEVPATTID